MLERWRWLAPCLLAGFAAAVGLAAGLDGAFAKPPDLRANPEPRPITGSLVLPSETATAGPDSTGSAVPQPVGPATPASGRVMGVISEIARKVRVTRYQHASLIRPSEGIFLWDCSGMAAWVLRRAAPAARAAVQSARPVARDFFFAVARAPVDRPRRGWQRLERLADARPGDVLAWLRPPDWPKRNTGHVGFILEPPRPVPGLPGALTVRISDATSIPHQDDTRTWPGEGGFGAGTLMFMTDASGAPTHYGWHGTRAGFTAETRIVVGRVTR